MPDNQENSPQSIEQMQARLRRLEEFTTKNLRALKGRLDAVTQQVQDLGGQVPPQVAPVETAEPVATPLQEQEFPAIHASGTTSEAPTENGFPEIQPIVSTGGATSPGVPDEPITIDIPQDPEGPSPEQSAVAEPKSEPSPEVVPVQEAPPPEEGPNVQPVQRAPSTPRPGATRAAPIVGNTELEQLIFNQDLAYFDALASDRKALVDQLRQGEPAAMALAGMTLLFRSVEREKVPALLKDVGEAYYRWRPHAGVGPDPMRDAFVAWVTTRCREAGIGNTIALVHVGDRYDSSRHNAKSRGVEVAAVFGWVVLRDNGKVYSKASVEVK